jgi:methyl-accepting chemotaxis protein
VVADAVRKLAEKTVYATKAVEEAIHRILASTNRNTGNVDSVVMKINAATDLAKESGDDLNGVVSLLSACCKNPSWTFATSAWRK